MQKWVITFIDDHGEKTVEQFEHEQAPTMEQAAQLIRERFLPALKKLDLNDLEGRTKNPTVESLESQNSIKILSITPIS